MNINDLTINNSEHKHSAHEAIMSGAANACPICQAFEIAKLKAVNEKLRDALLYIKRKESEGYIGYCGLPHGRKIDEALDLTI